MKINFTKLNNKESNKYYYIYIVSCTDDEEDFIKLGFTRNSDLTKRFKDDFPYKVKRLFKYKVLNAEVIEKTIHSLFNHKRYKPKKAFGGKTECYGKEYTEVFKDIIQGIENNTIMVKSRGKRKPKQ